MPETAHTMPPASDAPSTERPPAPSLAAPGPDPARRTYQVVAFIGMTVVAIAVGLGLHYEADVPEPIAAVTALGFYILMISLHMLLNGGAARAPAHREARPRAVAKVAEPARAPAPPSVPALAEPAVPPVAAAEDEELDDADEGDDSEDYHTRIRRLSHGIAAAAPETLPLEPRQELSPDEVADAEEAAVAALKHAHRTMRSAAPALRSGRTVERHTPAASLPPPPLPATAAVATPALAPKDPRLALAHALEAERLDVFLEPILGLADDRAHLYELSARVNLEDGTALDADRLGEIAEGSELAPWLDKLRFERATNLARRLRALGRPAGILTPIAGESLAQSYVREEIVRLSENDPAVGLGGPINQVVLMFTQADVRSFAAEQWLALGELKRAGYVFALDRIETLDMNLELVKVQGFLFARVAAEDLLRGLPLAGAAVAPREAVARLSGNGLSVIVSGIGDERQRQAVAGAGAALGHGRLLGAPRHVRSDPSKDSATRAA